MLMITCVYACTSVCMSTCIRMHQSKYSHEDTEHSRTKNLYQSYMGGIRHPDPARGLDSGPNRLANPPKLTRPRC